jgi:hypothetical protein
MGALTADTADALGCGVFDHPVQCVALIALYAGSLPTRAERTLSCCRTMRMASYEIEPRAMWSMTEIANIAPSDVDVIFVDGGAVGVSE